MRFWNKKEKNLHPKKHVDLNNLLWILKIISKGILPLIPLWGKNMMYMICCVDVASS